MIERGCEMATDIRMQARNTLFTLLKLEYLADDTDNEMFNALFDAISIQRATMEKDDVQLVMQELNVWIKKRGKK